MDSIHSLYSYTLGKMNDKSFVNICECDVEDKESLAHFRRKRAEWKRCLIDDKYSVSRQIYHLLWNDTVFRTFNEARHLSIKDESGATGLNCPLINLLDEGFVSLQVMAIRRLSDPNFYDPHKAVISIRRLIDDIGDNLDLFTRENYICFEGTKYKGLSDEKDGINWFHWDQKHKNFDRLSGVSSSQRSRKDKLKKNIISSLRSELDSCKDLRTYANKFIAHTSDRLGKAKLTDNQKRITFNNLDGAYKSIVKSSSFLAAIVLYEHQLGGIPIPQYDQFKNIDKPVILTKNISKLRSYWAGRNKEVSSWESDLCLPI